MINIKPLFIFSFTSLCISPTSSWIATRDADKVVVVETVLVEMALSVAVEVDTAKEEVDPGVDVPALVAVEVDATKLIVDP